jgi:hypothetical protein
MPIGAIEIPEPTEEEGQKILEEECYRQEEERQGLNDLYTYTEDGFCDGFTRY